MLTAFVSLCTAFNYLVGLPYPTAADQVCGKVEVVSCEGPSSAATLLLSVASGSLLETSRLVRVAIPADDRTRSGERIEEHLEGQSVCVGVAAPSLNRNRMVASLEQVTVREPRNAPPAFPPGVFRSCTPGVQPPTVISEVHPHRPRTALLDGTVVVQAIVDAAGHVRDVRVVRSLDPGTDAEVRRAFSAWRFRPGSLRGKPVPVVVSAEFTFQSS